MKARSFERSACKVVSSSALAARRSRSCLEMRLNITPPSQQNADQPVAALVDDALKRLLQAAACLLRHVQQLCLHALADQLVQALAENIRAPQLAGVGLKSLPAGFLISSSPCCSLPTVGESSVWMLARMMCRLGALADSRTPYCPPCPDDFGFFQCQFINARHDDAVARGLDLVKGGFDLVIGTLGPGQADDAGQKACLVHDVQPGLFTEDLIENIRGDGSGDADTAAGQIHAGQTGGGDVFTPQLRALACKVAIRCTEAAKSSMDV